MSQSNFVSIEINSSTLARLIQSNSILISELKASDKTSKQLVHQSLLNSLKKNRRFSSEF